MYALRGAAGLLARSRPRFTLARSLATSSHLVLQQEPTALRVSGPGIASPLALPHDWLRDSCQCTVCVHPSTRQKLVRTGDFVRAVPRKALIDGETVHVEWAADGHESAYPLDFLQRYADPSGQTRHVSHFDDVLARRAWDVSSLPAASRFVAFDSLERDPLPAFIQLLRYGILVVRGVPTESTRTGSEGGLGGVGELARLIGLVRETFYGRFWDVVSVRGSTNIAYTNLNLDLHMDLLYMQHPPHIQLLHCIKNRVEGGTSVFVDAIKAANDLWAQDRAAFSLLAETPIPFHYENDGHHLHRSHPTLQLVPAHLQPPGRHVNDPPQIAHVNYSPPFQAPLPANAPPELYAALRTYTELLARPEGRFEYTLAEGDCAVFDNRRVLHARTAFWDKDAREGGQEQTNRWLKGCYLEVDDLLDRTRVLLAKRGTDLPLH